MTVLRLQHSRSDGEVDTYHLRPGRRYLLGRGSACELRILDMRMSRQHAAFEHQETGWVVMDLGSTNGCLVDGKRLQGSSPLNTGTVIEAGSTRLTVAGLHSNETVDLPSTPAEVVEAAKAAKSAAVANAAATAAAKAEAKAEARATASGTQAKLEDDPFASAEQHAMNQRPTSKDEIGELKTTMVEQMPLPEGGEPPAAYTDLSGDSDMDPATAQAEEPGTSKAGEKPAPKPMPAGTDEIEFTDAPSQAKPGATVSAPLEAKRPLPPPPAPPSIAAPGAVAANGSGKPDTRSKTRGSTSVPTPPPAPTQLNTDDLPTMLGGQASAYAAAPASLSSPAPAPAPATASSPTPARNQAVKPVTIRVGTSPIVAPPSTKPGTDSTERNVFISLLGQKVGPLTRSEARDLKARELKGQLTEADLAQYPRA